MGSNWDSSDRRATLPRDWHRRRAVARRDAGGVCQCSRAHRDGTGQPHRTGERCTTAGTDADHRGDRLDHADLQWLCHACHADKTITDREAARPSATRSPSRHPGLI